MALRANTRVIVPGMRVKFFVDIINESGSDLDVTDTTVELTASPREEPERVAIRQNLRFEWPRRVTIGPEKRLTIPIPASSGIPTVGSSPARSGQPFVLNQLRPGEYLITACVNDRYKSFPYAVVFRRPDLPTIAREVEESSRTGS